MKNIMILDNDYPSPENLYGNVFVHTRVKEYIKYANVQVILFNKKGEDYIYENIPVRYAFSEEEIKKEYDLIRPDAIFIHFYNKCLFSFLSSIKSRIYIWVHGYEALGWYRRLFNYSFYYFLRNAHRLIYDNVVQMIGFRKIIRTSNNGNNINFVFVSNWMKRMTEFDSFFSKIKNYTVIPNPINSRLFSYNKKEPDLRKQVLMIRSFGSNKYANDIAIKAILHLSTKPFFNDLEFSIYGRGGLFKKLTAPLKQFQNVHLYERFLENVEIPNIHKKFGLFLCPTRQDAQGVSMCEAMSSGLVPLTSCSTAIPEFVEHGFSGLLSNNDLQLAQNIEKLYYKPELFLEISANAAKSIREKCDIDLIIKRELTLAGIL
ncbi:MAG: glycosyltransferase family 4 protein [Agriterribacter sp.]